MNREDIAEPGERDEVRSFFFLFCQETQWDQQTGDRVFILKCVSWGFSSHNPTIYLTQRGGEWIINAASHLHPLMYSV